MKQEGGVARALAARVARRLAAAGVGRGDAIVVGVSGGGDSVALLRLLATLAPDAGVRLAVAHLHHGLRGPEADADLAFVAALCRELGVALRAERVDVAAQARRRGQSVEAAGREARRRLFATVRRETGARWLALGHHADDQAETLLLRLMRGSGLVGAGAMAESDGDGVLRPLLAERRSTLRAYLAEIGQTWREDPSNLEAAAAERNGVRHAVLPAIEVVRAGAVANLARSAGNLRADGELLRAAVDALLPAAVEANGGPWRLVPWRLWRAASPALRRHLLRQAAWAVTSTYPPAAWTEAWATWPERRAPRPALAWLRVDAVAAGALVSRPPAATGTGAAAAAAVPLPAGGAWRLLLADGATLSAGADAEGDPVDATALALAAGAVVRRVRPGDRAPVGGRTQRLRDVLRMAGVPGPCRAAAWVVDAGRGDVWLPLGARARTPARDADGRALWLTFQAAPASRALETWPRP